MVKWTSILANIGTILANLTHNNERPKTYLNKKSTTISLAIQTIDNEFNLIFKFSTYNKLKRVTAYLRRFINNCKSKKDQRIIGPLVPAELANSETTIIKIIQNTEFKGEIQELVRNKQIHKSSNLLSLNPFLDKDNILRVGGRIRHSNVNLDQKHPIVIPGSHHVTKLIIEQEHKRLMHAGTGATLSAIRCKYWPVSGRNSVRASIKTVYFLLSHQPQSNDTCNGKFTCLQITTVQTVYQKWCGLCRPIHN
jgi:hypothetical protein